MVGAGVVLNNGGRIEFRFGEEGPEIIKTAGPKDVNQFAPPFEVCDVLFP